MTLRDLWDWICGRARRLWTLVLEGVRSEALAILNDASIQAAALAAVKTAAKGGLKGNDAFDAAAATLRTALQARGIEARDNLVDTLVQVAYTTLKNSIEGGE